MNKQVIFGIVTFLHDLFTAGWIGGLLTLGLAVLPTARRLYGRGPEAVRLMDALQQRLRWVVYASIVGLAVTGLLLARRNPAFGGLFSFANAYSAALTAKHLLSAAMVVVALVRSIALAPGRAAQTPGNQRRKVMLLIVNMVLGVLVLAATAALGALGATPPGR
jgi:putative copper export protein